jgi:hypothetical protein
MKVKKEKILFYDIETSLIGAWIFRCGKQVIRPNQLMDGKLISKIICITYCWNDAGPVKCLEWESVKGGYDCGKMIAQFDKLIKKADITIGKNSDRFDVKHINTQRLLTQSYGMPEWAAATDDLEKQMRRYFYLPSYGLDFFSRLLGLGGKISMQFSDWVDIAENHSNAKQIIAKMIRYGKKDTRDTRTIWEHCVKHFRPKLNVATLRGDHVCTSCGSCDIRLDGTKAFGKGRKQQWFCREHKGFAGYTIINYKYDDPKSPKLSS